MTLFNSITHGRKTLTTPVLWLVLATQLTGCLNPSYMSQNSRNAAYNRTIPPDNNAQTDSTKPRPAESDRNRRVRELLRLRDLQNTLYTPPHIASEQAMNLVRIAVLLPFSSPNEGVRREADGLLSAVQLALFTLGAENVVLLPKDTGGNPKTALAVTRDALNEGAAIIIGPLFSSSAKAIAGPARKAGIPILSFSTDTKVAGNGIYLLSLSLDAEIRRIIDWAVQDGVNRLIMFGPQTPYGQRAEAALRERAALHEIPVDKVQYYGRSNVAPMQQARTLSALINNIVGSAAERSPLDIQDAVADFDPAPDTKDAPALDNDTKSELDALFEATRHPSQLSSDTASADARLTTRASPNQSRKPDQTKIAILIPEGGLRLRSVAPLLPYHDVDLSRIQLLGTGLWNNAEVWSEPTLIGGVFAAPDPKSIARFHRLYLDVEGQLPGRLSSLGYDAGILAIRLAAQHRIDPAALENRKGFSGANGAFRLNADGSTEHALAVLRVTRNGQIITVRPAKKAFAASTSK